MPVEAPLTQRLLLLRGRRLQGLLAQALRTVLPPVPHLNQ